MRREDGISMKSERQNKIIELITKNSIGTQEELAEALKQLPEQSRNIVLMFFFLDMSDSEIGEKLNINRSTSYRHRRNSLEEIRKQLKEKKTNEE